MGQFRKKSYTQIEINVDENWYKYLAPFIYIKHKKGEAK